MLVFYEYLILFFYNTFAQHPGQSVMKSTNPYMPPGPVPDFACIVIPPVELSIIPPFLVL